MTCPECGGEGTCTRCEGYPLIIDDEGNEQIDCEECNGTGACALCHGSGNVE
jgi:hypothetical protein